MASTPQPVLSDETKVHAARRGARQDLSSPLPNATVEAHIVGPDGVGGHRRADAARRSKKASTRPIGAPRSRARTWPRSWREQRTRKSWAATC